MAGRVQSFAFFLVLILLCRLSTMHGIMARPLGNSLGHEDAKEEPVRLFLEPPHKVVKSSIPRSNNEKVFAPQIVPDNSGPSHGGEGHGSPNLSSNYKNVFTPQIVLDSSGPSHGGQGHESPNLSSNYKHVFTPQIVLDNSGPSHGGQGHY